ncbi:MAG: GNAT family N-acetyltransferase [Ancalomicrobiaceae bacterium]|nr:GNAT family N-acetyltransferase [Ancalomicrobiaceae bacterium]
MSTARSMPETQSTPDTIVTIEPSLAGIAREEWDACANPGWHLTPDGAVPADGSVAAPEHAFNPFVAHDFLWSLEEAGAATPRTGWAGAHLVARTPSGRLVGLVPCYAKTHSQGEYVFDQGWANAFERAGGSYYPKLQVSVPFTPATGRRLLVAPDAGGGEQARAMLIAGLQSLSRHTETSSVHATFLDAADAEAFTTAGWLERNDQQFHWVNRGYRDFDDFLDAFASRKRKQVKRERREAVSAGIDIRQLTGRAITEADWDAFFAFYMDTGSRKWGRPYLNRRFFSLLGERMAGSVVLIMAYRDGRAIAGALNLVGSDTLYGRYWGAIEEHPFLHFEVCYHQAVEFALSRGLKRVEAGAQGDHKLARGYEPVITRSAHFITDPGLRTAVARYLVHERAEVASLNEALKDATPYRRDRKDGDTDDACLGQD